MDRYDCFSCLSPQTYLYDPFLQKTGGESLIANPQHPDTIVLCTWPNARPYQVARYTSGYAALFPTSRILLIESKPETPWRISFDEDDDDNNAKNHSNSNKNYPYTTNDNSDNAAPTSPLHDAALALLPTSYAVPISRNLCFHPARRRTMISTARRGVLLHLFSTPGALQACELARAYRAAFAGRALDVQAVIFDAVPIIAHDWARDASILFYDGLAAGVASLLDGVLAWARGDAELELCDEDAAAVAAGLARDLNDRTLLRQGPRHCYVYPERNSMETWKVGSSTGGKVEKTDWFVLRDRVDVDREEGGMGIDERRYWGAIEELWY